MPKAFVAGEREQSLSFIFVPFGFIIVYMKKQIKTIAINVDRTVPSDSQPILAWDEQNQCYFMMTRKELMGYYDKQITELGNFVADYQKRMEERYNAMVSEYEKKFAQFTADTAEISNRMINLVEAINKGGK